MPFESGFRIVSPYGYRTDPITGAANCWHGGVDLVGNDRNVRAACGGTVLRSRMAENLGAGDRTWEWGNYVSVAGDDGRVIYYCHLESRAVEQGHRVSAGQILGIEGSTGRSTGIHLHFEVRDYNAQQLDPCAYLGIQNQAGYIWTPPAEAPAEDPWIAQAHDWSRDAVDWCVRRGILKGRGGDDYALGEPITREEMCVMLFRAREVL
jgi:murein DD-endopeptidase MepM/ murein hydrolase activator NlpD